MTNKERQFIENARQVLDDSVQDLDGATRARLAQARNAALDSRRKGRRRVLTWGTSAAGLAAAALVGILLLQGGGTPHGAPVTESYVADLEILADEQSLEFYEDMEFYEWLSEVEHEDDISGDGGIDVAPVAARTRIGSDAARCDERDSEFGTAEHGDAGVSCLV